VAAPTQARPSPTPRPARQPADDAPRPGLRLVRPGERTPLAARRHARALAALTAALVLAGLFGLVAFHVVLTESQLQLDRLQQRAAQQRDEYDRLRLKVAELEAPERVVAVAQQRLGMVSPPGVTYLSPTGVKTGLPQDDVDAHGDEGDGAAWATIKAHLAARP
jgi:cell division protein FtsL